MKVENFKCTQCGALDFTEEGKEKLRCNYCESLYFITKEEKTTNTGSSGVVIKKGAKVIFGKNANVIIKGKLEIEDGADVEFNGKITLLEKSSVEKIEQAKLRLIKDGLDH